MSEKREWKMDEHRVWVGEEGNVLYVDMQNQWTVENDFWMTEVVREYADLVPEPRYAVWMAGAGEMDMSKNGRRAMKESSTARAGMISKQSIVGVPKAQRVVAKIMIRLSGDRSFSFHDTVEEALASFEE